MASKGSEELSDSNWEEEPQKGFSSTRDHGSTMKILVAELRESDPVKEFFKDFESLRDQGSVMRPSSVESL